MRFHNRHSVHAVHLLQDGTVLCGTGIYHDQWPVKSTADRSEITCAACARSTIAIAAVDMLALRPSEVRSDLWRALCAMLDEPRGSWMRWRVNRRRREAQGT